MSAPSAGALSAGSAAGADEIDLWITEAREGCSRMKAMWAGDGMARQGAGPGDNPFGQDEPGLRRSWVTGFEGARAYFRDVAARAAPPITGPPTAGLPSAGPLGCHRSLPPGDR